jgi:PadR family transcriptional regulator, regulatory protein PadR
MSIEEWAEAGGWRLGRTHVEPARDAASRNARLTGGTFVVQPGSLFPALHRLEEAGWLASTWDVSENNRRAKYYRLTRAGRKQLVEEASLWKQISLAIDRALEV